MYELRILAIRHDLRSGSSSWTEEREEREEVEIQAAGGGPTRDLDGAFDRKIRFVFTGKWLEMQLGWTERVSAEAEMDVDRPSSSGSLFFLS